MFKLLSFTAIASVVCSAANAGSADLLETLRGRTWEFELTPTTSTPFNLTYGFSATSQLQNGIEVLTIFDGDGNRLDGSAREDPLAGPIIQARASIFSFTNLNISSVQPNLIRGSFRRGGIGAKGIPSQGLVSSWSFNSPDINGIVFGDTAGQSAIAQNAVHLAFDDGSGAYLFDGDGLIDFDNTISLAGQTDFTISLLVSPAEFASTSTIAAQRDTTGFNGEYYLRLLDTGELLFEIFGNGDFQASVRSFEPLTVRQTYLVTAGREGAFAYLYVNTALAGSQQGDFIADMDPSLEVSIGGDLRDGNAFGFNGLLDEFRLYDRALSQAEVSELYDATFPPTQIGTTPQFSLVGDFVATPLGAPPTSNDLVNEDGITGVFFDPNSNGQGFVFQYGSNGLTAFFYGQGAFGGGLWLISETVPVDIRYGESFTLNMLELSGGQFGFPDTSSLDSWGTLSLIFDTCDSVAATLSGNDGSQSATLIRLSGVPGVVCDG